MSDNKNKKSYIPKIIFFTPYNLKIDYIEIDYRNNFQILEAKSSTQNPSATGKVFISEEDKAIIRITKDAQDGGNSIFILSDDDAIYKNALLGISFDYEKLEVTPVHNDGYTHIPARADTDWDKAGIMLFQPENIFQINEKLGSSTKIVSGNMIAELNIDSSITRIKIINTSSILFRFIVLAYHNNSKKVKVLSYNEVQINNFELEELAAIEIYK